MEKNALKRILNKDIKEISKQNLNSLGIYIQFNEDNFFEAKAITILLALVDLVLQKALVADPIISLSL